MTTPVAQFPNLLDAQRLQGAAKADIAITEMLARHRPATMHSPAIECNDASGHISMARTGLASAQYTRFYEGIVPSKGQVASVRDTTARIESVSEVDARLVDEQPTLMGRKMIRANEAVAHWEAMSNMVEESIWYGDSKANPAAFTGLAPRFNDKSAENGAQILDAGGTGSNNSSIWLVNWGPRTCHLIYPKGQSAGIKRRDVGRTETTDSNGNPYTVYREYYSWHIGMALVNFQGVVRIANIDMDALREDPASGGANLSSLLIKACWMLDNKSVVGGRVGVYANRDIMSMLHLQSRRNPALAVSFKELDGFPIGSVMGHQLHRADCLLNTEARVV